MKSIPSHVSQIYKNLGLHVSYQVHNCLHWPNWNDHINGSLHLHQVKLNARSLAIRSNKKEGHAVPKGSTEFVSHFLHESAKEYLRSNNVVCWLFKAFVGNFHHRKSDIKVVDTGQEVKTWFCSSVHVLQKKQRLKTQVRIIKKTSGAKKHWWSYGCFQK